MVVIHPEYALLILEVNDLKDQIANLIVERDMLVNYLCKDLEIDYMLKIGSLEYKLIVAENNYQKNLKKMEMIREKQEQNKAININSIEKKIKEEFKKQTKVEQNMLESLDFAIEMSSLELFDYDMVEEMNADYFKLQKLYNPIFDLDNSEEKNKMYQKIEKYYQKGNHKKIQKMAEKYDPDEIFQDEILNLKKIREKYIEILKNYKKQIRKIKNGFPYNQRRILDDENLYRRKKENINKKIIDINIENKKIEKKINAILK